MKFTSTVRISAASAVAITFLALAPASAAAQTSTDTSNTKITAWDNPNSPELLAQLIAAVRKDLTPTPSPVSTSTTGDAVNNNGAETDIDIHNGTPKTSVDPQFTPTPTPTPTLTPTPTPRPGGQVLGTSTDPATLPKTGGGMGSATAAGLLGLGVGTATYLRARRSIRG